MLPLTHLLVRPATAPAAPAAPGPPARTGTVRLRLAAIASLALAACGETATAPTTSPAPASAAPTPSPEGAAPEAPLTLTARDFAFDPPTLQVPSGAHVTLTFHNTGAKEHSFTPLNGVAVSVDADAGTTQTLSFHVPASGTISFHCKYHPTQMQGSITITGGSPGAAAPSLHPATAPSSSY